MWLRSTGILSLVPKTLALIAVQNGNQLLSLVPKTIALIAVPKTLVPKTLASRSTNPPISEQHGTTGGLPTLALIKPSKSAHTPSLSVLTGQVVPEDGGLTGLGGGGGGDSGLGQ
jgi:hypothetical protein